MIRSLLSNVRTRVLSWFESGQGQTSCHVCGGEEHVARTYEQGSVLVFHCPATGGVAVSPLNTYREC